MASINLNERPPTDKVLTDIADYVLGYRVESPHRLTRPHAIA